MKITKDFIALTFSKGMNTPLLLIEMALMGRILGPSGFGQWSLLVAAATMLHSAFINWTNAITLKFGCEEWAAHHAISETLNTRIPIILVGLLCCLLLAFIQPNEWLSSYFSLNSKLSWLLILNVLNLWLTFEAQATMQALGLLPRLALMTPIITCASILFLLTIISGSNHGNFITVALGVSLVRILLWGSIWLTSLKNIYHWRWPKWSQIKNALCFSWPLIPSLILGYCSNWSDHVILSWYSSDKAVGLWGASYQIMSGIIALNSLFVTVLLPWLLVRNQKIAGTQEFYLNQVAPTVLSLWLLLTIVIVTLFPLLFTLFMGNQFHDATGVILMLGLGIFTNVFSSLYGLLFNVQNRLKHALLYNFIIVITNIIISLLLVPKIGIMGSAIGTVISLLIGHGLYVLDQHYYLNISLKKSGSLFLVTLFLGLLQYLSGDEWWIRLCSCLISLAILITTIRKTNSIEAKLIHRFFTGIFNPVGFFLERILVKHHVNELS